MSQEQAVTVEEPTPTGKRSVLVEKFLEARRVATPLVAINTPDAAATIDAVMAAFKTTTTFVAWDAVRGLYGLNKAGQGNVAVAVGDNVKATLNLTNALGFVEKLPAGSITFIHNAHRTLDNLQTIQAITNLRDVLKVEKRTLVLLGVMFKLPPELANDVYVLDEPLPTREELGAVIDKQFSNAKLARPDNVTKSHVLDAIIGLPQFPAESVLALSFSKEKGGIDIDRCWERKVQAIEATGTLSVWRGDSSLDDIKGNDQVVAFMRMLVQADAFGAIVFLDEMDKAVSGGMSDFTGDSGVSKDQVKALLTYIEDTKSLGVLYAGVAGCGKTELAKATARAAKKPLIMFDLGAMKGGTVGASEGKIRMALKTITAVAEGRVLFLGTANRTSHFTPELNRRFRDQFFFDLPNDEARAAMWPVYTKRYGISKEQSAFAPGIDAGWTGDEIRRVCERASLFRVTVPEAARFIVPQAISARDVIKEQRLNAAGRMLSAAYPGVYQMPTQSDTYARTERAISVGEADADEA